MGYMENREAVETTKFLVDIFEKSISLTDVLEGRYSPAQYLKEFWGMGISSFNSVEHLAEVFLSAVNTGSSIGRVVVPYKRGHQYRVIEYKFYALASNKLGVFDIKLDPNETLGYRIESREAELEKIEQVKISLHYSSYQTAVDVLCKLKFLEFLLQDDVIDESTEDIISFFSGYEAEIEMLISHFEVLREITMQNLELVGHNMQTKDSVETKEVVGKNGL
jgi:hypothetical protein